MDSVSQLVLGAGVAHLVLAPRIGRRALVLGAVLGTLPDLDVLVRYDSAVDSFTRHRSWSHSLLVLTLITPVVAWLARRLMQERAHTGRWLLAVWLVLITHPVLDAFTVYGTQLWWPLGSVPVAWGSLFIIDPLFTIPVLTGLWLAWRNHGASPHRRARVASIAGLLLGCGWIGWSQVAQQQARQVAIAELDRQGVAYQRVLVAPFPGALLWRYVVLADNRYLEGYHSLLDEDSGVTFTAYPKGNELLASLDDPAEAERLRWFTHDLVRFEARGDTLAASDLRMGAERFYVFEFELASSVDGSTSDATSGAASGTAPGAASDGRAIRWQAITPAALPQSIGFDSLSAVVRRMWDESVDLVPPPDSR